jgi:hypothetical protein
MINLTDKQRLILTAATARVDRLTLPLPEHIRGGATKKVVTGLLTRGLVEEVTAEAGAPIWRVGHDGAALTLVATDAAFAALGLTPPAAEPHAAVAEPGEPPEPVGASSVDAKVLGPAAAVSGKRRMRAGTKQAQMIAMLEAPEGATVPEIAEATGWQPHTVRGAIAGALRKRLGLLIASEKVDGRGRVYRIGG